MAKITDKNIKNLEDWNMKELRKLKIMCKNRRSAISLSPKKEISDKHLLYGMDLGLLDELVLKIQRQEKKLSNS